MTSNQMLKNLLNHINQKGKASEIPDIRRNRIKANPGKERFSRLDNLKEEDW